jgi:hypothetical protein
MMIEDGVTFPVYFADNEWRVPLIDVIALVKSMAERYPSSKDLAAELLRVVEKIMDSDFDNIAMSGWSDNQSSEGDNG